MDMLDSEVVPLLVKALSGLLQENEGIVVHHEDEGFIVSHVHDEEDDVWLINLDQEDDYLQYRHLQKVWLHKDWEGPMGNA